MIAHRPAGEAGASGPRPEDGRGGPAPLGFASDGLLILIIGPRSYVVSIARAEAPGGAATAAVLAGPDGRVITCSVGPISTSIRCDCGEADGAPPPGCAHARALVATRLFPDPRMPQRRDGAREGDPPR